MKNLMLVLVLVAAVPAMAVVTFTAEDIGGGQLKISYTTTEGDLPRGIALRIEITGTGTIDEDAMVAHDPAFNTFIDWAYSNPSGYVVGNGHAMANPAGPGVLPPGFHTLASVCMGVLDEGGNQVAGPATADPLITLQLVGIGSASVEITADTLRGPDSGVVGSTLVSNLSTAPIVLPVVFECFDLGHADYAEWDIVGKPDSWCNPRQCHGDANNAKEAIGKGTFYVGFADVDILLVGFNKPYSGSPDVDGDDPDALPDTWISADFSRTSEAIGKGTFRVGFVDVDILLTYFNKIDELVPADCN